MVSAADPERGDSVVVLVNSGGGTVNGYGLAAAQLERIKVPKIPSRIRSKLKPCAGERLGTDCVCGRSGCQWRVSNGLRG